MFQGPQWGRTSLVLHLLYRCLPCVFQWPQWGRTAQVEQNVFDSVSPCYVSGASVRESGSSWTERFWQCFSLLRFRGLSEGERLKLNRMFLTVFLPVMFQGPQQGRAAQAEQDVFDSVSLLCFRGLSEGEWLKLNRMFLTVFLPIMFQGPQQGRKSLVLYLLYRCLPCVFQGPHWGRAAQAEQNVFDSVSPCYVSGASVRESGSSWTECFGAKNASRCNRVIVLANLLQSGTQCIWQIYLLY